MARAAGSVAGPQLRNMGTIGGNLCLDTRCTYYNQTYFWRNALGFCLKKDGDVCHVTKVGKKCVAAHSADTAPVLMTLLGIVLALLDFVPFAQPPFEIPLAGEATSTIEIVALDAAGYTSPGAGRVDVERHVPRTVPSAAVIRTQCPLKNGWMSEARPVTSVAPAGLGVREASMYGLMLAVVGEAVALGAGDLLRPGLHGPVAELDLDVHADEFGFWKK